MISSAGMALPAYIGNDNFIILTLLMGIYYVLKKKTLFHLQKQYLLFIGCLFFSMLLVIIGSTLSLGTALSVTSIPLIIYATYKIDPANYLQRFIKLIFYIALISIILFTITRIYGFNSFSSIFPHLYTSFFRGGEVYSYGGFLYRFVTLHSDRNCGPFSEPGQYQCVLSSALYFIMFHPRLFEAKERIRYIIVFFLALITTLSTSGYIGIVILVFCYLLHSLKTIDKRMKYAIIITIIGTMLFMSMTKLGNEFMNTVVFHKIYANGQLDFSLNSGGARTISISSVLTTVYNHPITLIGVGYDELHNMGVEGCAGFLFLLLAVGIMSFSILFGFCFHQVFKYNKSIWDIMVRILLVLNMGLSQPHIMNVALFTMMLYPYFIVVDATILGLETKEAAGHAFNIGTGVSTDVLTVANTLCEKYNIKVPISISGNYRLGDIRHNYANITLARTILGYEPKWSFSDGIGEFCKWVNTQEIQADMYDASILEMKEKGLYK